MRKNNKKGFTLAELLIVIAIIAILIAIAIPAFSASLRSAGLATDHSNIRSAYAIYRTAEMLGTIDIDATTTDTPDGNAWYWLKQDGTIEKTTDATQPASGLYLLKEGAKSGAEECASSLGCQERGHAEGAAILIQYKVDDDKWEFHLDGGTVPTT